MDFLAETADLQGAAKYIQSVERKIKQLPTKNTLPGTVIQKSRGDKVFFRQANAKEGHHH